MLNKLGLLLFSALTLTLIITSCNGEETNEPAPIAFDRAALLEDWADLIIIPAYEAYVATLEQMTVATETYITDQNDNNLDALRETYITAYSAWQRASIFEIGKAEELSLSAFSNVYPTDESAIFNNISANGYNLELPSNFDAQGFPALDFLLYGLDTSHYSNVATLDYIRALTSRLHTLANTVLTDWKGGYRAIFIDNDKASGTASVDKLVNDFIYHYERNLRAGKIGIPAGVFSASTLPQAVEAPYSGNSKKLYQIALQNSIEFFEGKSFEGSTMGLSLSDYLEATPNGTAISTTILNQWAIAQEKSLDLTDNLSEQVEINNNLMLEVYDELQKVIVPLKVDMLQALNIQVDFIDADGD